MTGAGATFLDALKAAADKTEAAEASFRKETARQLAALEQARTYAFRRLNLMRAVASAVAPAEDEGAAVAGALATLREKVGWASDGEARAEVLLGGPHGDEAGRKVERAGERYKARAAESSSSKSGTSFVS